MSATTFDPKKPLKHHVKMAIANHDILAMYALKDICDKLHAGVPEVNGFTQMPEDQLYEEMDRNITDYHDLSLQLDAAIKSDSSNCKLVTAKGMLNSQRAKIRNHETRLPDLWMGSIPKLQDIKEIDDAIVMPKFDGCSCGVKYNRSTEGLFEPIKATTRGIDTSHKQQTTDILDKFITISEHLTTSINNELISDNTFKFANGLTLANIQSFTIRGEIVAADKSQITTAAAPYISGKVNGGMQVWQDALANICFLPYEIMRIQIDDQTFNRLKLEPEDDYKPSARPLSSDAPKYILNAQKNQIDSSLINGVSYVPTQIETIDFLDKIEQLPYDIFDGLTLKSDALSLNTICDYYQHYQDMLDQPADGIVYCSANWRYPQYKSETTTTMYTKYAWKPTSESTTRLTAVNYNISRDGKLGLEVCYEPIKMNGKTFSHCKTAPTRMNKLAGIGVGSVITIELCKDINPQIKEFEDDPSVEPYCFPIKCPFCGSKIDRKNAKAKDEVKVTLTCTNKGCTEQLIQKYKYFLTHLKIKGVAEGKLRKLGKSLNINSIISKHLTKTPNAVLNALNTIQVRSFLLGLGYGTSSQIEKATPGIDNYAVMVEYFDTIIDNLLGKSDDPFIVDILNYIDTHCFEEPAKQ